jgi:hypothetical protein
MKIAHALVLGIAVLATVAADRAAAQVRLFQAPGCDRACSWSDFLR